MRSAAQIRFRLRQEAANVYLLFAQPTFHKKIAFPLALPEPGTIIAALRGSVFESSLIPYADAILAGRLPIFDTLMETGPAIDWRRDYAHQKTSNLKYFRLIPYLNFDAVGDHKYVWEINRHQHLVLLAQTFLFTQDRRYLEEIWQQLRSWLDQNPFQRGINWTSALEVAFRALSWIWIWHLVGAEMPAELASGFVTSLRQHGLHLRENLSVYFSPNTHLLGEAVALHALGKLFPEFPESRAWEQLGARVVEEQLAFQVRPDGSHFEQSTYYHVYALDFFLYHYLLAGRPRSFEPVLLRMAEYLEWLLGPARRIAFFGDDDGGRLFHPFGPRDRFGRATLATCAVVFEKEQWRGTQEDVAEQGVWWLGLTALEGVTSAPRTPQGSRHFPDSGAVFLQSEDLYVQLDAGPFGWKGAGHSHADTLSLVAWFRGEPLFTDPGTFTYLADPEQREAFRGTAAHNTVSIDGLNQAMPVTPFRWAQKPEVELLFWEAAAEGGMAEAECRYAGFTHRRRVLLEGTRLLVLDEIEGPAGEHTVRQNWQLGPAAKDIHMAFSTPSTESSSAHSRCYGTKEAARSVTASLTGPCPLVMAMLLNCKEAETIDVAAAREGFRPLRKS